MRHVPPFLIGLDLGQAQDPTALAVLERVTATRQVDRGQVQSARVLSNTTRNDALADCILSKARRLSFSRDVDGEISWPLLFAQK